MPALRLEYMIAHTLLFADSHPMYMKMAKVLAASMAAVSPSVPFVLNEIRDDDADLGRGRMHTYRQNTRKTRHFADIVNNSTNGAELLLLDCDMLCIRDAGDLALGEHDLAITYRNQSSNRYLFNSGVVALRVSEATKDLCTAWDEVAQWLLKNEHEHAKLRKTYGGINQSSLGYLLERRTDINVLKLSTREWNALPSNYPTCLDETHFIHIMGSLRRLVTGTFSCRGESPQHRIARVWKEYAKRIDFGN